MALTTDAKGAVTFGVPEVDNWLMGGLRRAGVHEFYAVDGDAIAATAITLLLGQRACREGKPVLWLRERARKILAQPHAPGLVELGLAADAVLMAELQDLDSLLQAGNQIACHAGVGAIVLEVSGRAPKLDLTASRRLSLATERSGTMVLVVRSGVAPVASAAHTRWEVASAPSTPLAANAPGYPVFDLKLLRQRGGRDGLQVQLEWNREQAVFRTPLSGGASAVPAGRAADRQRHRAA